MPILPPSARRLRHALGPSGAPRRPNPPDEAVQLETLSPDPGQSWRVRGRYADESVAADELMALVPRPERGTALRATRGGETLWLGVMDDTGPVPAPFLPENTPFGRLRATEWVGAWEGPAADPEWMLAACLGVDARLILGAATRCVEKALEGSLAPLQPSARTLFQALDRWLRKARGGGPRAVARAGQAVTRQAQALPEEGFEGTRVAARSLINLAEAVEVCEEGPKASPAFVAAVAVGDALTSRSGVPLQDVEDADAARRRQSLADEVRRWIPLGLVLLGRVKRLGAGSLPGLGPWPVSTHPPPPSRSETAALLARADALLARYRETP